MAPKPLTDEAKSKKVMGAVSEVEALIHAVKEYDADEVRAAASLFKKKTGGNVSGLGDTGGRTPLHLVRARPRPLRPRAPRATAAAAYGKPSRVAFPSSVPSRPRPLSLSQAAQRGDPSVIRVLVTDCGVPVDVKDKDGVTPLMSAADYAKDAAVRELLKLGAKHDAKKSDGVMAVHRAASSALSDGPPTDTCSKNAANAVRILVEASEGARTRARSTPRRTRAPRFVRVRAAPKPPSDASRRRAPTRRRRFETASARRRSRPPLAFPARSAPPSRLARPRRFDPRGA